MTELTVEALAEKLAALETRVQELEERTTDAALSEAVSRRQRRLSP